MGPVVITPVKNSLETTIQTIGAITASSGSFEYIVFNDFSDEPTERYLAAHAGDLGYTLVNLRDHVQTPSPNYRTVLIMSQKMALDKNTDLIIVESDVIVQEDTLENMLEYKTQNEGCGMVAAITVDEAGKINFPYNHISSQDPPVIKTKRSLSFCCTLLSNQLLRKIDFSELRADKDWYDVHISQKSRIMGFDNYLLKNLPVQHLPHSSRPWKMEKYSNPLRYYFKKFFLRRDRI